jgi:hypothetical protein
VLLSIDLWLAFARRSQNKQTAINVVTRLDISKIEAVMTGSSSTAIALKPLNNLKLDTV